MPQSPTQSQARLLTPALLGWIAGLALQLQQSELWPATHYGLPIAVALALLLAIGRWHHVVARLLGIFIAAALLAHASTGLRATLFQQQALDPALEGKDISITGRISAMP
ncbi:MAG: competence protein ComEC, partial [Hylemonella sp.]